MNAHSQKSRLLLTGACVALAVCLPSTTTRAVPEPADYRLFIDGSLTDYCSTSGPVSGGDLFLIAETYGTETSAYGSGFAEFFGDDFFILSPDVTFAQTNEDGVSIATSKGRVSVGTIGSYDQYLLQVHDLADGTSTATRIETLSARRSYSPSNWEDGELEVDTAESVTLPAEIRVVEGESASGWAWVRFVRADEGDVVTCRYRGNETGEAYEFVRCTDQDGESVDLGAGSEVTVTWLSLHVQSGNRDAGPTVVEAEFSVLYHPTDFVSFTLIEVGFPFHIHQWSGYLATGDAVVEELNE